MPPTAGATEATTGTVQPPRPTFRGCLENLRDGTHRLALTAAGAGTLDPHQVTETLLGLVDTAGTVSRTARHSVEHPDPNDVWAASPGLLENIDGLDQLLNAALAACDDEMLFVPASPLRFLLARASKLALAVHDDLPLGLA